MKKLIAFMAFLMMSQAYAQTAVQVVPVTAPQQPQQVYVQPQDAQAQYMAPSYQQQAPAPQPARRGTMVYDERTNQLIETPAQAQAQVQTIPAQPAPSAPSASAVGANPIVILNNQRVAGYQGQSAVQELPVSVVEDSPLKASAADGMRKKRQETELGTEDSIVQALERARMEDELRRRNRFNNALAPLPEVPPQAPPVVYQPAPQPVPVIQQVAPPPPVVQPIVVEKETKKEVIIDRPAQDDKIEEKSEIRESYQEVRPRRHDGMDYYVGALVGTDQSVNAQNVHGGLNTGVQLGVVMPSNFVIEGNFNYASYSFDDAYVWGRSYDVKQYGVALALKYQIGRGLLRPNIGISGGWVRRSFDFGYGGTDFRTSDAFDIGPVGGLDVVFNDTFSVGLDLRYMTNVFYTDNTSNNGFAQGYSSQPWGTKAPEKTDYYTASVVAKFLF